jgi:hypothetical protein
VELLVSNVSTLRGKFRFRCFCLPKVLTHDDVDIAFVLFCFVSVSHKFAKNERLSMELLVAKSFQVQNSVVSTDVP